MTDTVATVQVGKTIFLPLTYIPTDGEVGQLAYTAQSATGFVTYTPVNDAGGLPKGLSVTGVKKTPPPQPAQLIATCPGEDAAGAPIILTSICRVTVTNPPIKGLQLGPAATG